MQILSSIGFENNKETKGLDIIKGEVDNLLNKGCKLQLPHTGWNEVNFLENSEPLTSEFQINRIFILSITSVFLQKIKKT